MDHRLKRSEDFDRVFKNGKRVYGKSLMMLYIKANSLKIGYSVSKKHGKAVVRNQIKRKLRAAIREVFENINGNYYIVLLPKVKENYDFHEYLADIKYLMNKEKMTDAYK